MGHGTATDSRQKTAKRTCAENVKRCRTTTQKRGGAGLAGFISVKFYDPHDYQPQTRAKQGADYLQENARISKVAGIRSKIMPQ